MNELKNEVTEVVTEEIVTRQLSIDELQNVNGGQACCFFGDGSWWIRQQ